MVAAILKRVPRTSEYVFPASRTNVRGKPTTSFNGWPKCKQAFDARCAVTGWTLHDLRRTFATNLAALGIPPHITERLLNHVSGTISGVAAIYNKFQYVDEMRAAITAWETRLDSLLKS
jgi:integrase